jgi:murein DD-endopeptidase MepM/ murein hydrolase activator NlpD
MVPFFVLWQPTGAHAATPPAFGWPLTPHPVVTRPFDNLAHDWLPGHRGVDLAGTPGQPVLSAGSGTVVFAGQVVERALITVAHAGGLRTTYEPVVPSVPVGALVGRGSVLGRLSPGHPGCPVRACLHWGLLRRGDGYPDPHGRYLDPMPLLHLAPLRLKPPHTGPLSSGSARVSSGSAHARGWA